MKTDCLGFVGTDVSVFYGLDAGLADGDESKIGGDGRGKMQRGSRPKVIGHPLQPAEEIQFRQPQAAHQREDGKGQKNRRGLSGLIFTATA